MSFFKTVKHLLKHKNAQIKKEREKSLEREWENRILAAYLAILIEERGELRIPKEMVSDMLGSYRAEAHASGDDYVISIVREKGRVRGHGER